MTHSEASEDGSPQEVTHNSATGFMTGKSIIVAILTLSLVTLNYFSADNPYKGVDALLYWLMFGVGAAFVYLVTAYFLHINLKTNEKLRYRLENILLAIIWLALLGFLDFIGLAFNPVRVEVVNPSGDIALISNDLSKLNSQVFKGFQEKNRDIIIQLMGDEPLPNAVKALDETLQGIPNDSAFEAPKLHHQFHLRLLKMKPTVVTFMQPLNIGGEQYSFFATMKSNESVLSLQTVEQGGVTLLMSALYEKRGDQWFLNSADLKPYKLINQMPSDWLVSVQDLVENMKFLPAQARIAVIVKVGIFRPAWFIESQLSTPFNKIARNLHDDIVRRYQFPIEIETIESKPIVLQVKYIASKEVGLVPNISVVSQLTSLGSEVFGNEMKTITTYFSQIFPEILTNTPKVVFTIYASMPTKEQTVKPFAQLSINLEQGSGSESSPSIPAASQP